jgi:uncharacterized C2H2 Zn-finger protein
MSAEVPLRCPFCALTFKRATSLAAPVDSSHDRCRSYSCSACSYEATHVSHFKKHVKAHPNPQQLLEAALNSIPNYCPICNRYFRQNHVLTEHMALAHNNAKPYSCDECGAEFNKLQTYRQHAARHGTLQCDQCDAQFGL